MRLNLYRVDGGYLLCPADAPVPESHASELKERRPDLQLLSRDTAGRQFIEDHMRNNGAAVLDDTVAETMLAGCSGWANRKF